MINIIFSDSNGGVKSASESLYSSFCQRGLACVLYNQCEIEGNIFQRIMITIKFFWNYKKNYFIFNHFEAIFTGLLMRLCGFKNCINVVHTDLVAYYNSVGLHKRLILTCLFFSLRNSKIVFVSKESELKAKSFFGLVNTSVIYNVFIPYRVNFSFSGNRERIILGSVSRLHASKNIDFLIRLLRAYYQIDSYFELQIYGDGDQYESLKNYIEELNCNHFIKLMGGTTDRGVIFSSIDAMVSLSSIEGFGITILESISHCKPVLYSDCSSGPRELMSSVTDPLVKTSNFEKTDFGYLVRPFNNLSPYAKYLDDEEFGYINYLSSFIDDVRHCRFEMKYDFSRFSVDAIIDQWLMLLGSDFLEKKK